MNVQSRIHCFSLLSRQILQRVQKDIVIHKMLVNAIKRMSYIGKKQKAIKGLQFGNQQNELDHTIGTGVEYNLLTNPDTNIDNNMHYNIEIKDEQSNENNNEENIDTLNNEEIELDEVYTTNNNTNDKVSNTNNKLK